MKPLDDQSPEVIAAAVEMHRFLTEHFGSGRRRWWIPPYEPDRTAIVALADAGLCRILLDRGHFYALPPRRAAL